MNKQDSPTLRKCLCCGKQFKSSWIGNRVCSRCSASPKFSDKGGFRVVTSETIRRCR